MIAILGGSFDPIHEGHLDLATRLLADYGFEKLYFVPAKKNPLKSPTFAAPEARLTMTELAVGELSEKRFGVLDWEVRSQSPSYTLVTVERLLAAEKKAVAVIMGDEVFATLETWHEPKRLVSEANLIVVMREGTHATDAEGMLRRLGITDARREGSRVFHSGDARWIDEKTFRALPFSATGLRSSLGKSFDDGVMPHGIRRKVWLFIKENRLYAVK